MKKEWILIRKVSNKKQVWHLASNDGNSLYCNSAIVIAFTNIVEYIRLSEKPPIPYCAICGNPPFKERKINAT